MLSILQWELEMRKRRFKKSYTGYSQPHWLKYHQCQQQHPLKSVIVKYVSVWKLVILSLNCKDETQKSNQYNQNACKEFLSSWVGVRLTCKPLKLPGNLGLVYSGLSTGRVLRTDFSDSSDCLVTRVKLASTSSSSNIALPF